MLFPAKAGTPDCPGASGKRDYFKTFCLFLHGKVTLPVCVFLVLSGAQAFADTTRPINEGKTPLAAPVNTENTPCRGKMAMPEPLPEPLPCQGDVAEPTPPPCKGEGPMPNPPPCAGAPRPNFEPPRQESTVQEPALGVSIRDLIDRPRLQTGKRITVVGTLGRLTDGSLFESGYFLYNDRPVSPKGEFYGCPLVGSFSSLKEGSNVTVVGRVVQRRENSSPHRRGGTYFVLEVESLQTH